MTLEHRLHHAARELREVPIDIPPLGMPARSRLAVRAAALAAPVLFALGGVVVVAGALGVRTDEPTSPASDPAGRTTVVAAGTASPSEELELIATLVAHVTGAPSGDSTPRSVPPGPRNVV